MMEAKQITELGIPLKPTYDWRLVALSLVIAIISSYTALDMAGQVAVAKGYARHLWLAGSAIALGVSIWVMHFVAMLAFRLPIPTTYDVPIVILSMVVAIAISSLGLFIVTRELTSWLMLLAGSSILGLGIVSMHFTAMAGMKLAAVLVYDLKLVILADAFTIFFCFTAMLLQFHPKAKATLPYKSVEKIGSAVLAGIAIDALHYLAMAAVQFYPSAKMLRQTGSEIDEFVLAIAVATAGLSILILGAIASFFGQRLSAEIARTEALRESERRYQNLYDFAPDTYLTIATNGTIKSVNQSGAESLGYSKEELTNNLFWNIVHESDREWVQQLITQIFTEKLVTTEAELRKVLKDGSIRWERQRSQLFFDGNQTPIELRMICRDITQRKQIEEQLRQNAFHDALTGLPNRVLFMDRLGLALEHTKRHEDYLFAVLFLDLDRFKVINDSLGHFMGDRLLVAIAHKLQACLRPTDTVARLGGDEFTILIEDIQAASDAIRIAERVQEELALPFTLNEQEVFTSASIGIALSTTGYENAEDLLRDADIAMYQAKSQGSDRYRIFNPEMHARAVALLQLEIDLRNALERQEFRLHYQPIISLVTGRIVGFEALIRWQHPRNGLQNPAQFLRAAEEAGLISRIGHWVLCTACSQMRQWQLQLPETSLTMSVNLSGQQFNQPDLIERIDRVLQDTGLNASHLRLEITEGAIMEGAKAATKILQQLRDLGVQLSIDDFGTGYSSLGRLYHFPFNGLKIDRSFVAQMGNVVENTHIVETILTLARKLELDVTAEGVETDRQLAQLRSLQCEYGQGNFFSVPLDSKAAEALLKQNPQW